MEFPKKNEDKLNAVVILAIALAACALVYASVIGLQALYRSTMGAEVEEQRFQKISGDRDFLYDQQYTKIRKSDINNGRLAIDKAKAEIVERVAEARNAGTPSAEANLVPKVGTMTKASYIAGTLQSLPTEPVVAPIPAEPVVAAPVEPEATQAPAVVPNPPTRVTIPGNP